MLAALTSSSVASYANKPLKDALISGTDNFLLSNNIGDVAYSLRIMLFSSPNYLGNKFSSLGYR